MVPGGVSGGSGWKAGDATERHLPEVPLRSKYGPTLRVILQPNPMFSEIVASSPARHFSAGTPA